MKEEIPAWAPWLLFIAGICVGWLIGHPFGMRWQRIITRKDKFNRLAEAQSSARNEAADIFSQCFSHELRGYKVITAYSTSSDVDVDAAFLGVMTYAEQMTTQWVLSCWALESVSLDIGGLTDLYADQMQYLEETDMWDVGHEVRMRVDKAIAMQEAGV